MSFIHNIFKCNLILLSTTKKYAHFLPFHVWVSLQHTGWKDTTLKAINKQNANCKIKATQIQSASFPLEKCQLHDKRVDFHFTPQYWIKKFWVNFHSYIVSAYFPSIHHHSYYKNMPNIITKGFSFCLLFRRLRSPKLLLFVVILQSCRLIIASFLPKHKELLLPFELP